MRDAEVGLALVGQALQHPLDVVDVFTMLGAVVVGQLLATWPVAG
ncbi:MULTISPECIES: hypothetical protein [unclassified Streptomyces]|uniref:Uncharacterized protein n=1 Tax=Streptomyces sp. NBC_00060 TaxID=2975636 RepID=A0AAU2GSY0_9ACTN